MSQHALPLAGIRWQNANGGQHVRASMLSSICCRGSAVCLAQIGQLSDIGQEAAHGTHHDAECRTKLGSAACLVMHQRCRPCSCQGTSADKPGLSVLVWVW